MVKCWYMDNSDADQRLEHHLKEPKYVTIQELQKMSGVEHFHIDTENYREDEKFIKLKTERGYTYEDVCEIAKEKLPNYEEKIKMFFEEHLHTDEEIRFILEGSGYFDVRNNEDTWIRILVEPGDMLIVPAGIYHRFTLDTKNYVKAVRLFVGEPVWTPHNRPVDDMESRKDYLKRLADGFIN